MRTDIATGWGGEPDKRREHRKELLQYAVTEELTARQREILRMSYEEGLNCTEIAARLGITASTVSRTRTRALARLRRCLRYCE